MNPAVENILFVVAVLALFGWSCHQLWSAFSRGYVLGRMGQHYTRRDSADLFWFFVVAYGGSILVIVAAVVKLVLSGMGYFTDDPPLFR